MKVNVSHLLNCAAIKAGGHYGEALRELTDNLRELRDRSQTGDYSACDEFFSLYRFGDETDRARHE